MLNERVVKSYWKNGLFEGLLRHLEVESYDEVCLGCSELLFRMTGDSEGVDSLSENEVSVIEEYEVKELVDRVLVLLSRWRSRDPGTSTEGELIENLFNVLCMMIVGDDRWIENSNLRRYFQFCMRRKCWICC